MTRMSRAVIWLVVAAATGCSGSDEAGEPDARPIGGLICAPISPTECTSPLEVGPCCAMKGVRYDVARDCKAPLTLAGCWEPTLECTTSTTPGCYVSGSDVYLSTYPWDPAFIANRGFRNCDAPTRQLATRDGVPACD